MKDRKPIDFTTQYGFRKNHTQIATEVRELEAYNAQLEKKHRKEIINNDIIHRADVAELEKKLKEAVEIIKTDESMLHGLEYATNYRRKKDFIKSIEQEES